MSRVRYSRFRLFSETSLLVSWSSLNDTNFKGDNFTDHVQEFEVILFSDVYSYSNKETLKQNTTFKRPGSPNTFHLSTATFSTGDLDNVLQPAERIEPIHMISGQLTDHRENFALVHGLTPVTVHMSFSLPWGELPVVQRPVTSLARVTLLHTTRMKKLSWG